MIKKFLKSEGLKITILDSFKDAIDNRYFMPLSKEKKE